MNRTVRPSIGCSVLSIVILTGWLISGCGYHFRADGKPVGLEIRSLAIPLVESTSSESAFEADFTKIIRDEFISHGRVPIVSVDRAQLVLSGRIYDIKSDPLTYAYEDLTVRGTDTTYEVTKSRRLRIKLDIKLTDKAGGRVIWDEKAMEEKASYRVGTDPLRNRDQRRQALERIARLLAKRIYMKTMERF